MTPPATSTQSISGKLEQWLIDPSGDADGLLLVNGTQVSFPPHLSATLSQATKPGDSLQIIGLRSDRGNGALRASTIESSNAAVWLTNRRPAAPTRRRRVPWTRSPR